jgi:hypothetical protein
MYTFFTNQQKWQKYAWIEKPRRPFVIRSAGLMFSIFCGAVRRGGSAALLDLSVSLGRRRGLNKFICKLINRLKSEAGTDIE